MAGFYARHIPLSYFAVANADTRTLFHCCVIIPSTVVPRTFAGPFVPSLIGKAVSWVVPKTIFELASRPMMVQFLIWLELLLRSWAAHAPLSESLAGYFGRGAGSSSSHNSPSL